MGKSIKVKVAMTTFYYVESSEFFSVEEFERHLRNLHKESMVSI